ncbi:MAG TPA: sarcosine oxidase subunit gamma family protein [Mesorhizobium sp.]
MADFNWTARSPLQRLAVPGHYGVETRTPGIVLSEVRGFDLVLILARRGQWAATAKAVGTHFGVAAPAVPRAVAGKAATIIWSGPDQVLALSPRQGTTPPLDRLKPAFEGIASLSDQSDGRALIAISGPDARNMLAKVSSLDLHDGIFPVGAAAATSLDHTAVTLWRATDAADGSPVFNLLVFTSFAESLWHTILDASLEYGVEVSEIG